MKDEVFIESPEGDDNYYKEWVKDNIYYTTRTLGFGTYVHTRSYKKLVPCKKTVKVRYKFNLKKSKRCTKIINFDWVTKDFNDQVVSHTKNAEETTEFCFPPLGEDEKIVEL